MSVAMELPPEEIIRQRVKAELRKRMRGVRKATPKEACAARSAKIAARLLEHRAIAAAKRVALFWPIEERHEVDLRSVDADLRARGVAIAYPAIDPDNGTMTLRFVDAAHPMEERGYGFCEPTAAAPEAAAGEIDVLVVPALAIDPVGHRIGYGAGYYDRTIPRYAPPAVTIGVAYDFQLVAEVPFTEHDVPLAWVVTDARVIEVAP
jgi:5-formyltetrahydrofolate cyclo-ligase